MTIVESISMHCLNEKSDKVYHMQILKYTDGKYIVGNEYGRRGGKLTYAYMTKTPVSLWKAKDIFNKQKNKELKKGYRIIPCPDDILVIVSLCN
jgi:small-conductance mechanosensitive channel